MRYENAPLGIPSEERAYQEEVLPAHNLAHYTRLQNRINPSMISVVPLAGGSLKNK